MNTTSLVKMTLGVALATLAAFNSDANEITPNVTSVIDSPAEVSDSSLLNLDFSELLSEFDADEDGTLSEAELSESDNEMLKSEFDSLDINSDSNLSVEEFGVFKATSQD